MKKDIIQEKPKIVGVFKELNLIAQEINVKFAREDDDGDSEYYYVDADPDVTETVTCTDCVCSSTEARFKDRISSYQMRFVLPNSFRIADKVNINLIRKRAK